LRTVLST